MLLVCFRPQIAERGTQDFSTRLIKHTELGKRVLRAGIKALAITKTFPNIRVTHHTPAQPLVTMGPKYLWILVWIFSFHYMYSRDCQWCPRERSGSLHILWGSSVWHHLRFSGHSVFTRMKFGNRPWKFDRDFINVLTPFWFPTKSCP